MLIFYTGRKLKFPGAVQITITVPFLHFPRGTSCFLRKDRAQFTVHFPAPFHHFSRTGAVKCTGNSALSWIFENSSCVKLLLLFYERGTRHYTRITEFNKSTINNVRCSIDISYTEYNRNMCSIR